MFSLSVEKIISIKKRSLLEIKRMRNWRVSIATTAAAALKNQPDQRNI